MNHNAYLDSRRSFWREVKDENRRLGWTPDAGKPMRAMGDVTWAQVAVTYPRPANGSKRWMHWSALCWPQHAGYERHLDTIAAMKCGGVKFLSDGNGRPGVGDSGLAFAQAVLARGMVPVVRYYMDADHRWSDGNQYATEQYVRVGCRYIETINEPDLDYEWSDDRLPKDWARKAFDNWIDHARRIISLGGIPLSPALASGFLQARGDTAGQLTDNPFVWVKQAGIPYFACSIHNYALNHPISYPADDVNQKGTPLTRAEWDRVGGAWAWDSQPPELISDWRRTDANPGDTVRQDDSCFRACEVFRAMLDEAGYPTVPIITTEGGPCLTDRQDRRYPRVGPVVMQELIADELAYMAKDPLYLGYSWWLFGNPAIGGSGGWSTNQWFWPGGPFSESDHHIPIVRWMRERPLSADGVTPPVTPDPPADPPEEEEEPPVTIPTAKPTDNRLPTWNKTTVRPADAAPGEAFWHVTRLALPLDDRANTAFIWLYDENGNRLTENAGVQLHYRNTGNGETGVLPWKAKPDPQDKPMQKNDTYEFWVTDAQGRKSDVIANVHTRYAGEGINLYHVGLEVDMQLGAAPGVTPPDPPEEPDPPTPPGPTTSTTTAMHGELVETWQDGKRVRVMLLLTPDVG